LAQKTDREIFFTRKFLEDLRYWIKTDRSTALRLLDLVDAIVSDPFYGIGKPEPLKHELGGCWSRRITKEDRLIYRVSSQRIDFLQARFHY